MGDHLSSIATNIANDSSLLREIKDSWPLNSSKPDTELRAHVGAFASGAAVVSDESVIEGIREHKRSLLAIDMEAYGVARAVASSTSAATLCVIAKGVQDFADSAKSDEVREYAAFVSARFMAKFVIAFLGSSRESA